jgi:predicted phage terminase large subunit-like protein
VIDIYREQAHASDTAAALVALAETYKPLLWFIDDDNASKVYMSLVATEAKTQKVRVNWNPMPMRGQNKEVRAAALRGMFKRGLIYFDEAHPHTKTVVKEALQFPNATGAGVDDCIDALALIGRYMHKLEAAHTSEKPTVKQLTTADMTLNGLWDSLKVRRERI